MKSDRSSSITGKAEITFCYVEKFISVSEISFFDVGNFIMKSVIRFLTPWVL